MNGVAVHRDWSIFITFFMHIPVRFQIVTPSPICKANRLPWNLEVWETPQIEQVDRYC